MDLDIFTTLEPFNSENTSSQIYHDNYTNFTYEDYGCEDGYLTINNTLRSPYYHATIYIMYSTIMLISVVGNGMVCIIVKSTPRMQTVTNYFIVNMATGDLLMAIFCVPSSSISMLILYYWPFGTFLCGFVNYSQAVSVLVSAYTLVAISIDRYMAILWPLKPRITKRYAMIIISIVWLFALLTALPIAIVSGLTQPSSWHKACNKYVCTEVWPSERQFEHNSMALMVLQFLIPLVVLIYTYTRIAIVVWCKRIPGEAENTRDQRMQRSKRKMIKMMVTVVAVFTMCWLPFNALLIAGSSLLRYDWYPYMWFLLHWLAMSHSCYNPIIYCYMNARFRSGFLHVLASVPCCKRCITDSQGNVPGFTMTGASEADHSLLQRVNTCSTYVTLQRKVTSNPGQYPIRSASVMRGNSNCLRRIHAPDSFQEEQI